MITKKVWVLTATLCLIWVGMAQAHGDISKLPNSVQIAQYQLGLWIDPEDIEQRNGLAMAYYRTGKFDEAVQELNKVLAKDPMHFNAMDGMGIVLIKMNKNDEAVTYLKKALEVNADDAMVHVHLSVAYDRLKMAPEAAAELEKARTLQQTAGGTAEDIDNELKIVSGS